MTGAVLDRPPAVATGRAPGRRVTLEERLDAAVRMARTQGSAECPVCHGRLRPATPPAGPGGALTCDGCGSRLD